MKPKIRIFRDLRGTRPAPVESCGLVRPVLSGTDAGPRNSH